MEAITTPKSPDELRVIWNRKIDNARPPPIVMYDEVISSQNIDRLFRGDDSMVIFYPGSESGGDVSGHYVSLVYNPVLNVYFFADSYGGNIDHGQKKYADPSLYQEETDSLRRHLLDQMMAKGAGVDYSHHRHQGPPPVATCGLWSLNRCKYAGLTNDQYDQLVRADAGRQNLDQYVAEKWA